ncbi:hypothetical protein [Paraglaciecola aestuariivivens]
MQTDICYQFNLAQNANRFLNELKHWPVAKVQAKLFEGSESVKVSYQFDGMGFDYTLSELDNLAAKYAGVEL